MPPKTDVPPYEEVYGAPLTPLAVLATLGHATVPDDASDITLAAINAIRRATRMMPPSDAVKMDAMRNLLAALCEHEGIDAEEETVSMVLFDPDPICLLPVIGNHADIADAQNASAHKKRRIVKMKFNKR